jgi:hypothetical protein
MRFIPNYICTTVLLAPVRRRDFSIYLIPYVNRYRLMDEAHLHACLMEEARRYDPAENTRSRLAPFRDVLLAFRAKSMSYEQIAATLSKHGLKTSPAGVGVFCRRTFAKAEILREQSRIRTETPKGPAATAPSFPGLSALAKPEPVPSGRRGPKIARDDY